MKLRKTFACALLPTVIAVSSASGQTVKLDTGAELSTPANWFGGSLPSGTGTGVFNSTLATLSAFTVGTNVSFRTLQVVDPAANLSITIGNTRTFTLGDTAMTNGMDWIDMSSATKDLTISAAGNGVLRLIGTSGTTNVFDFNVAADRKLTIDAPIITTNTRKALGITGAGTVVINGEVRATAGLLGLKLSNGTLELNNTATNNLWVTDSFFEMTGGTLKLGGDNVLRNDRTGGRTPFSFNGGIVQASGADRVVTTTSIAGTTPLGHGFRFGGSFTVSGDYSLELATGGGSGFVTTNSGNNTLTNSIATGKQLKISSNIVLSDSAADNILTIDGAGTTEISGSIANGGTSTASGINKIGNGKLTLGGANNTYAGATTVSAGILLVNGLLSSSAVSVTGGTFGGGGTVGSNVTFGAGSAKHFAPGASPGSLEIAGNLSLSADTTTTIELGGTSFTLNGTEQYDRTKMSGTSSVLTLAGTLDVNLFNSFVPAVNQAFGIFQLESTTTRNGTFEGLTTDGSLVGNFGGTDLFITYSGNFGDSGAVSTSGGNDLVLYTVPEPNAAVIGGFGLLVLLRRRRN